VARFSFAFGFVLSLVATAGSVAALELAERGERVYRKCASCHQVGEGAVNRVGPTLDGVVGRAFGAVDGFRYSENLLELAIEGRVWDIETLDRYLEKPRDVIPKGRMAFAGLRKKIDRQAVIAYLQGFDGESIPEATAVEHAALSIEGDVEWGEYLAGECVTCHRAGAADEGIPSIVGWSARDFILALVRFQEDEEANPAMRLVVGRLSDEELAALAAYYSGLAP